MAARERVQVASMAKAAHSGSLAKYPRITLNFLEKVR